MYKAKKKTIKITVLTLFPDFIQHYTSFGIISRAIAARLLQFKAVNIRKYGLDKRGTVDDRPYGGGLGMVFRPDVLYKAIKSTLSRSAAVRKNQRIILLCPQGKPFNQQHAKRLSKYRELIFVSGRYEGFDERIRKFVDEEISIGDYVLMGGELPALVIGEAVLRLIPGVLGKDQSADNESFSDSILEYPQYTKPEILVIDNKKMVVPKVLRSGHHAQIESWRQTEAQKRTAKRRPDLLTN